MSDVIGRVLSWIAVALAAGFIFVTTVRADTTILNVSYDVSRELYKEINPAFAAYWAKRAGEKVMVNQSHGGSSRQALSVIGGLVPKEWRQQFPRDASPYTTTSVFLVRNGNPKGIKDWSDLTRQGLGVIVPNPKTSGNGRYTYLAAWGYALTRDGSAEKGRAFVSALFANVPVLDGGGRGASTTFTQRDVGDVLVTFENEAIALIAELGADKFEIVYPTLSIDASVPVAVVSAVVDKRGTREVATAYLSYLFTPEAQAIIAKNDFRPRDAAVLAANSGRFPAVKTFTVEEALGGWAKVQTEHFADGGICDQIVTRR